MTYSLPTIAHFFAQQLLYTLLYAKGGLGSLPRPNIQGQAQAACAVLWSAVGREESTLPGHCTFNELRRSPLTWWICLQMFLLVQQGFVLGNEHWAGSASLHMRRKNVPKRLAALLLGASHSVSVKNQRGSCWETASWHLEIIPCSELLSSGSTGAYLFAYSCRVLFLPCHITVSAISNCKE